MFKKFLNASIIFVALFCLEINFVYAYDFVNSNNESGVTQMIEDIYEKKDIYETMFDLKDSDALLNMMSSRYLWWPIGSAETTTINGKTFAMGAPQSIGISDGFGCGYSWRGGDGCHNAIDISGLGLTPGTINVIAAKDGIVLYPTSDSQTQFEDKGYYKNPDGGGCGNYVILQHSDGVYTVYCHMAKNSITVRANDTVRQGEVIGKVGHSGSSTGPHLHFSVRVGGVAGKFGVDPLDYVDPTNPRPIDNGSSFSLISTTLTRDEFIAKMNDYCKRSGNKGFCNNFASIAGDIYDTSLKNHVNPELVVVTAGAESSWTLEGACAYTNNFWGIKITNGKTCNEGGVYSSVLEGVEAYAEVLASYSPGGSLAGKVTDTYKARQSAGCSLSGHGLPGTLEGMQSLYSWVGAFRYSPGNNTLGGCVYLDGPMYEKGYCVVKPTCTKYDPTSDAKNVGVCPETTRTTICEQNDYTAWQLKKKTQMRYNIFGL